MHRHILQKLLFLLGFFVFMLATLPLLFKGSLKEIAQKEFKKVTGISISFEDLSVNAFRNFPNLSVSFYNVRLLGPDSFPDPTIANIGRARARLDISSLLKRSHPIMISSIGVKDAQVNWFTLESGASNLDFFLADKQAGKKVQQVPQKGKGINIQLRAIRADNLNFYLEDLYNKQILSITGASFRGSGLYEKEVFSLDSRAEITSVSATNNGIHYLSNIGMSLNSAIELELDKDVFHLTKGQLQINELTVNAEGLIESRDSSMFLDFRVFAPDNSFKSILSLIPNAYTENFGEVKSKGIFSLEATIKGALDEDTYPGIQATALIKEGRFNYPEFPLGIENIAAQMTLNYPGQSFDQLFVEVPYLKFLLGKDLFEADFKLSTPLTNPNIDLHAKGQVDLASLFNAFPFPALDILSGILKSDIAFSGNREAFRQKEKNQQLEPSGTIEISQLFAKAAGKEALTINHGEMKLVHHKLQIAAESGAIEDTDFDLLFEIEDIFAWLLPQEALQVYLRVQSNEINLNNWIPGTLDTIQIYNEKKIVSPPLILPRLADRITMNMEASANRILYGKDTLQKNLFYGTASLDEVTIKGLSGQMKNSNWDISAELKGIKGYLLSNDTLSGTINFASNVLDISDFFQFSESSDSSVSLEEQPGNLPQIPDDINIAAQAAITQLIFGDIVLKDAKGDIKVHGGNLQMEAFTAKSMGGRLLFSGNYNSKIPGFDFFYDLQNLDFGESFQSAKTFRILMPIGQYLQGSYSSNLFLQGKLLPGFSIDFNTLEGKGYLETSSLTLKGMPVFEKIGEQFKVKSFQEPLAISPTKNWFDISEGFVSVQDFNIKAGDFNMLVGGKHSVDQRVEYRIVSALPITGGQLTVLMPSLKSAAGQLPLETLIEIDIKGKIGKPELAFNVLGVSEQRNAAAEPGLKLKEIADRKADSLKTNIQRTIKEGLDSIAQKPVLPSIDSLGKTAEDIKKQIEQLNPFKKKKKNNK